jgi:metallo-beta-lactamase family protein
MKIKFCGAAQEVTGSCHLITLNDGFTILLDCGLYQGHDDDMEQFNEKWLFNPRELGCLILSHAHIDHTGRVPKLVADGFEKSIHCTHATHSLCGIMLMDSAQIQEADAAYRTRKHFDTKPIKPLYTKEDAYKALRHFTAHPYDEWFHVHPNVRILYRDAGHILGSASVTLEITENGEKKVIAFTGDLGRPNRPILRDPQPMPDADYVICESTYGDRDHLSAPNELEELGRIAYKTCVEKGGKLIIPAFSVGRTQEVTYMLDQLNNHGLLPHVPVYIDSPLAINATDIFISHPECFDEDMHQFMINDANPFGFKSLQYVRSVEGSKALNKSKKPCIIISASGMMNAGRIQHHLFNNIENARNTFLIVGYCAPQTPGGILRSGEKSITVFGQNKQVLAEVAIMDSFSAHGDRREMADIIKNQQKTCKTLFLVHGTIERQEPFKTYLKEDGFTNTSIEIPTLGQEYEV